MKLFIVASGYLKTAKGILMVANEWRPEDPTLWSLPGGTWENGKETLTQTLEREFVEETGVKIKKVGDLLYTIESISQSRQEHFMNMTFEVIDADMSGLMVPENDERVVDFKLVPSEQISELPMLTSMKEPLMKYIGGDNVRFHQYLKTFKTD